ncbi:hypothetical protein HYFRA_00002217 [Hymenoscyphus fraxineus]|uniref:Uncharacterized protein n=1 Tax=Hymenoscyphus fraxineus TaxID=746836 RepID=A0A9N9PMV2_9HELO|nr:hypothetical protein HYFRA_00002217 [Hymenoscyphus fraxineus]
MWMSSSPRSKDTSSMVLFAILSLAALGLSICVLLGCSSPTDARYSFYSVNGTNITRIMGKNCTACVYNDVADRYMFGMSGVCRGRNGTLRCDASFPSSFDITALTFEDIGGSSSSNASSVNAEQFKQYASTTSINHPLVQRLSKAVAGILIASAICNLLLFIPMYFFVQYIRPKSRIGKILSNLVVLDCCALCAAVGMVYSIFRNEVGGVYEHAAPEIHFTKWPVRFELGFWFLVGAAASRVLNIFLAAGIYPKKKKGADEASPWRRNDGREAHERNQGRANRISISHDSLTYKIAGTIEMLRAAVQAYPAVDRINEGCKELLRQVPDNHMIASAISPHFNRQSCDHFLGIDHWGSRAASGNLLWASCPNNGYGYHTDAIDPRARGVYLIVLSECCHGGRPSTTQYHYVGSGRSVNGKGRAAGTGGVMRRVAEHTSPEYRHANPSTLYNTWHNLQSPCVAIYLLAEWNALPTTANPASDESFDDILLAEAVWQVMLQTFTTGRDGNWSDFTAFLQGMCYGHERLFGHPTGCNVDSALEKKRGPRGW